MKDVGANWTPIKVSMPVSNDERGEGKPGRVEVEYPMAESLECVGNHQGGSTMSMGGYASADFTILAEGQKSKLYSMILLKSGRDERVRVVECRQCRARFDETEDVWAGWDVLGRTLFFCYQIDKWNEGSDSCVDLWMKRESIRHGEREDMVLPQVGTIKVTTPPMRPRKRKRRNWAKELKELKACWRNGK